MAIDLLCHAGPLYHAAVAIQPIRALLRACIADRNPLRLAWHRGKAAIAALAYAFPARKLVVVGITGTDGKTTTVGMIAHILQAADKRAGALSTAAFRIGDRVEWNVTQKTSPSPFFIQRFLRRCVRERCTHAILEMSSHGLVQGRLSCTWPSVAAITNTTPEHLDYHGTMEQYRKDKGIIFRMLRGRGTKVLNAEDATYEMYKGIPSEKTIVYGTSSPSPLPSPAIRPRAHGREAGRGNTIHLQLSDVTVQPKGTSAVLRRHSYNLPPTDSARAHGRVATYHLTLNIPGMFNGENALCAIACAEALGIPTQQSLEALRTFAGIPGRMELIEEGQPFAVFVDFTVTPAAYRKTLVALRSQITTGRRLLVLTGSCGDRMREKRPEIGKIVSQYADIMVVTNEDPYTENPENIINEVWAGIDHAKTKAHRIPDRKDAILFLFKEAKPGDVVLLCGKGSDTTMWTREGQIPWNEREITRSILRSFTFSPQRSQAA